MSTIKHLADRAVIRIAGEDRRAFLQGLITQDIERLSPDNAIFSALLTPQGKILFDFMIAKHGDAFLIDCDKAAAPMLAKRLTLYKLRAKVTIEIDEELVVMATEKQPASTDDIIFPDPRLPALGWRIIAHRGDSVTCDDYDRRRITLGVPQFGKDFGPDEMFLLDVNYDALNGVSYSKGCFVGQEVTSRMKRKSEVRKRTVMVEYDGHGAELAPDKGAEITAGDFTLGQILSGADGAALALIRLDRWGKSETAGATPTCEGRKVRMAIPEYLKHD